MSRRRIDSLTFRQDLRADRDARPEIRWEPSKSLLGLRSDPSAVYGTWRGRSGRRGTFQIFTLVEAGAAAASAHTPIVLVASRPGADGLPDPVRATWFAPGSDPAGWLDGMARIGATEIHIHRLASSEAEAAAFAADLSRTLPATGLAA